MLIGVPRETTEEKEFGNFDVFGDNTPYSTFYFYYTALDFDRLVKLIEFNVKLKMDIIKQHIAEAVSRKQRLPRKNPVIS
jgi:hypothetical protein